METEGGADGTPQARQVAQSPDPRQADTRQHRFQLPHRTVADQFADDPAELHPHGPAHAPRHARRYPDVALWRLRLRQV